MIFARVVFRRQFADKIRIQNSKGEADIVKDHAYFLPSGLNIHTEIVPEKRNRGIYSVVVYNSKINVTGKFETFKPESEIHPAWGLNQLNYFMGMTDK